MSIEKVRNLLTQLHDELGKTDMDAKTRSLMQELEADIRQLLDPAQPLGDSRSIMKRAQELETDFATQHPLAERIVREIVDTLTRMGV
jgi:uncharacterized membrane protein YccC